MDKVLEAALAQVPALVVLVIVVVYFLRHMKSNAEEFKTALSEQRRDWMSALKQRDEMAMNVAQDCHRALGESSSVIKENTRMFNRVEVRLAEAG